MVGIIVKSCEKSKDLLIEIIIAPQESSCNVYPDSLGTWKSVINEKYLSADCEPPSCCMFTVSWILNNINDHHHRKETEDMYVLAKHMQVSAAHSTYD